MSVGEDGAGAGAGVDAGGEEQFRSLRGVSPLLTEQALSTALSDWFHQHTAFTRWEYVGDTGKGDSYLSDVIRIRIHGETEAGEPRHVQVVTKTIPANLARRLTYRSDQFFRNEINFYTIVLPALLRFQDERSPSDPFREYARLFLAQSDGEHDVICLEDASLQGYGAAARQQGIDLAHCRLTVRTLARFHALSFAMRDQRPAAFDAIRRKIFETYYHDSLREWYGRFWARIGAIAVDAVEREYPDTVYARKIREFCVPERYDDMIAAATDSLATGVVSHGDSWTNNFLFKYEAGSVTAAKVIDVQLTRCASPVLDLSFMLYACTTHELRREHYDSLLRLYHAELGSLVRQLGSDPEKVYGWDLFMAEIKKYSYFGLAFSFESTPFIVLEPEDAVDMDMKGEEKLNIDDVWQIQPFKKKEHRLREANNVVHAVDRGFI